MQSILLLGSDPPTVSTYRGCFEQAGFRLASTEILEPLSDFIRLARPAAVLLDLTRAKMDGRGLVKEIRSEQEFKLLPLFVLIEPSNTPNGLAGSGATGIFPKDLTKAPEVVEEVTRAVQRAHTLNQPQERPAPAEESAVPTGSVGVG
jgi:CheY-like chemotaxis protein